MSPKGTIVWNFGAMREGGGRTVGHDFLEGLARESSGLRHVCVADRRLLDGYLGARPAEVVDVEVGSPLRRLSTDQMLIPSLARRMKAGAVISLGNLGTWLSPVPHGVFIQTPYLAFAHGEMEGVRRDRRFRFESLLRAYFRPLVKQANGFVVQTETMRSRFCAKWGIESARVRVIRGSVSAGFRAALGRNVEQKADAQPLLVTASSDGPHKNLDYIPRAAAEVARRGFDVRFAITVDPRSAGADRLRRAAAALGVRDRLVFVGRLGLDEMAQLLRRATAAFLPSLLETLGLPYLEAEAAGVRVLAADRPFARESCAAGTLFFNPLDPADGARAIAELLRDRSDRREHREIDRTADDVVQEFVAWASELAGWKLDRIST